MKEHPIIMDGESVRGLLDGAKTQTRRVIKPQPPEGTDYVIANENGPLALCVSGYEGGEFPSQVDPWRRCPYGVPGDVLWVRETWATDGAFDDQKPSEIPRHLAEGEIYYVADSYIASEWLGRIRPSIYMCRWMARLVLRAVDVRVERLQDITSDDILAEGMQPFALDEEVDGVKRLLREAWIRRWDAINAERGFGWDTNPWIFVIEFERIVS